MSEMVINSPQYHHFVDFTFDGRERYGPVVRSKEREFSLLFIRPPPPPLSNRLERSSHQLRRYTYAKGSWEFYGIVFLQCYDPVRLGRVLYFYYESI